MGKKSRSKKISPVPALMLTIKRFFWQLCVPVILGYHACFYMSELFSKYSTAPDRAGGLAGA
jgi:hypothetical protein